jgi:hypothetical protein
MASVTEPAEERSSVIDYLREQLIGPLGGKKDETLYEQPSDRYMTSILYPIRLPEEDPEDLQSENAEEDDERGGQLLDPEDDDPITLSGQQRPSSAGLTFVTSTYGPVIADLSYGRYSRDENGWRRKQSGENSIELSPDDRGVSEFSPERGVSLEARWRPLGGGAIVTVVVVNRREQPPRRGVNQEDCLFQVKLRCRPKVGSLQRYPTKSRWHRDEEAEEIELQYREVPIFSVGHGVAADWDHDHAEPDWVEITFLPSHTVPDVSFKVDVEGSVLSMLHLSRIDDHTDDVIADLGAFINLYDQWVSASRKAAESVPGDLHEAAERLLHRMEVAGVRMRRGIKLLAEDRFARRAFGLANLAMLMQIVHSRDELAGSPHSVAEAPPMPGDEYLDSEVEWRPFQLAFLLLTIGGVVDGESEERDLVDLIWFPTGGGKTEAYLGLAAFTILHRRLTRPLDGAGTTVITRYTLRLLTTQQFQRAATMILACDRIREARPADLGDAKISIGIWVGGDSTPNRYSEAVRLLRKLQSGIETTESFQVDRCPWCGTRLTPEDPSGEWGIDAAPNFVRFQCLNRACDFADSIPISSVDQDLYENPPTLLVGTVDKFARLAWDERAGAFLGARKTRGPSLIIQDEFHLISGPLGTLVGLYEAAFDVAMRYHGANPKIVAATATIRRAGEQTRGVFGRDVSLFPPAGLDVGESFFVHTDSAKPGRQYVGVMPQGHTPVMGMVMLAAALLQAPCELDLSPDVADAYWTLLAYHNSLRELGKTITLAHDDFRSRIETIASTEDNRRELENVGELTSRIHPVKIPEVLDGLGVRKGKSGAMSLVAATNMVSVGVDVTRLGLMLVNGQPKTTAEYIQATSRVGRASATRPGLVATMYSPGKPRDRSHYESFVPYHSMLYSAVEPTSVTPFSLMARNRALHAGLVILARHAANLPGNDDASGFDRTDPRIRDLMEQLVERAASADEQERHRVREHLDDLACKWEQSADAADEHGGLRYKGHESERRLLRRFLEDGDGWPTLDSMRSVDQELPVVVRRVRR